MSQIIIDNEFNKLTIYNPYNILDAEEIDNIIYNFMTLLWLLYGKKITKVSFFIEIVENEKLSAILKEICGFDDNIMLYREILIRHPAISSSKLVKNRLKNKKK